MRHFIFLIACFVCSVRLFGNGSLPDKQPIPNSGEFLSYHYFVDSLSSYSFEEIIRQEEILFQNIGTSKMSLGFLESPVWVKLEITPEEDLKDAFVELAYPLIDQVVFYAKNEDGQWEKIVTGDLFPFYQRPANSPAFLFPVHLSVGKNTFYFQVKTESSVSLPLRIWSHSGLRTYQQRRSLAYGLYYGAALIVILYNLFLFLSLRKPRYLLYILSSFFIAFSFLYHNGLGFQLFWPNSIHWNQNSFNLIVGLSNAFTALFAIYFLNLRKNSRVFFWILSGFVCISLGVGLLWSVVSYRQLIQWSILLTAIQYFLYLAAGVISWKKGQKSARFFLLAWATLIASIIFTILKGLGLVSTEFWLLHEAQIGSLVEMMLLSLALADQINEYKKAQALAEKKSLEAELEKKALTVKNQQLSFDLKLKEQDLRHEKRQLAATTLWLTEKNRVLREIRQVIGSMDGLPKENLLLELSKKITSNLNADQDWERFKVHFEKVHSGFFTALQSVSPELTTNEQRLCAYLRMNLSSKEIAIILGVSVTAVEQARRRVRKKLGISNTDINLYTFLQNVPDFYLHFSAVHRKHSENSV